MIKYRFCNNYMTLEFTDLAVITKNPFFHTEERIALSESLRFRFCDISVSQPCRFFYRTVDLPDEDPKKPVVLFLHDFSEKHGSSWFWIKFSISVAKRGMKPILLDLPGFGQSHFASRVYGGAEFWVKKSSHLVERFMAQIDRKTAEFVAYGRSCAVLFILLKHLQD